MTTPAGESPAPDETYDPDIPEPLWKALTALASEALPIIRPEDVPKSLRRFTRFAPVRRAALAAAPLRQELRSNATFRQHVAQVLRDTKKDEIGGIRLNASPGDDPVHAAAVAYVLRNDTWKETVAEARRHVQAGQELDDAAARIAAARQRASNAEHERATMEREVEKLRTELRQAREEVAELKRQHKETAKELREVTRRERKARDASSADKGRLKQAEEAHRTETRQLKNQLAEAMRDLDRARRGAKEARELNESRTWLLLETISGAAHGLRRELALNPVERPPADFVADDVAARPDAQAPPLERGLAADDPARLDELLALPRAHLIIDGYNVTLEGYAELTLEQQRTRLVRSLGGIAAQAGAEVTVVFDGADKVPGAIAGPRGVRVLFSRKGQTADEVIKTLVRNEPNGRPVVVISSDKEVASGTARHGAYALPSSSLLRRLSRG